MDPVIPIEFGTAGRPRNLASSALRTEIPRSPAFSGLGRNDGVRRLTLATVVAATLGLAGCPVPIPSNLDSGIAGTVLAGPQCPVIGPNSGPECDDKPLAATIVVRSAAGVFVTQFTSDADGQFRVPLFPGSYTLEPQPVSPSGLPHGVPQTVEVQAGQFTEVTIEYDTGIR